MSDHDLVRITDGKWIRYRVDVANGASFVFVGYQEPVERLPAGTLLRISLAHWWQPADRPNQEARCYAQLSGWFSGRLNTKNAKNAEGNVENLQEGRKEASLQFEARSPLDVLQTVFGYAQFRPKQRAIIDNILAKRDTLVILPTGGGKSLCYQLPALLFDGITVVVSPLIALMEDQVSQLQQMGISAEYLNSTVAHHAYTNQMRHVRAGQIKLLYLSPETFLQPEIRLMLDESNVTCVAIDEAHCISSWGHDFRPEYRQLAKLRTRYRSAVWVALTATATERVQADIRQSLQFGTDDCFVGGFDRPNLFIGATHKTDTFSQIRAFLKRQPRQSGIIYCGTRKAVDSLSVKLNDVGYRNLPYHAGLPDSVRHANQRAFIRDNVPIMVATIAFGMGIDKPDVRFVLHTYLPKNIESYYQHIGRAGRDGLPATCLLLYNFGDVKRQKDHIDAGAAAERIGRAARLQAMVDWAESTRCRRRPLLAYFGEMAVGDDCGQCDNCTRTAETTVDISTPAQKLLACIYRTGQLYGAAYVIKVLRGRREKQIVERGHDKLSTYGIGRKWDRAAWQHVLRQLVNQNLLHRDLTYGSLLLTTDGIAALKGVRSVHGTLPNQQTDAPSRTPRPAIPDYKAPLFNRLREKRKALADAANVPPYVIFSDQTLLEMAAVLPQTRAAFGKLHGVGRFKLKTYAAEFLPLLAAHNEQRSVATVEEDMVEKVEVGEGAFSAEISF